MTSKLSMSTSTWFSSNMSTNSNTTDTEMFLQSCITGQQTADFTSTMATSTLTAERETHSTRKSFLQPRHNHSSSSSIKCNNNNSSTNNSRDWSIPVSKFLNGFRVQAAASLSNAYRTHHPLNKAVNTGIVTTSLAEDIFFLVDVQLNVLHDFLEDAGILNLDDGEDVIEDALLAIFRCIWNEQTRHRDTFLTSFELCCATANDFFRMMTRMEDLMTVLELKYPFLEWNALDGDTKTEVIRREANDLATLFVSDAVHASQTSHLFVMRTLKESSFVTDIFSRDWEDRFTHNEVIMTMIRVFEEYNNDLQNFLCNDYLYHKVVVALVRASVCYYVQLLLKKASNIRRKAKKTKFAKKFASEEERRQELPFACPARALCRMMYDIRILQDYFLKIARDSSPLTRVVSNEMNTLTVIHEFLGLAVGHTGLDSLEEFIVVIHKRSGANGDVTRHFLSDLWLLGGAPDGDQEFISVTVAMLKAELDLVTLRLKECTKNPEPLIKRTTKDVAPRLEDILQEFYEDRIWQEKIRGCGGILKPHH